MFISSTWIEVAASLKLAKILQLIFKLWHRIELEDTIF